MGLVGQEVAGVEAPPIAAHVGSGLLDDHLLAGALIGGPEHASFVGIPDGLAHEEAIVEQHLAGL